MSKKIESHLSENRVFKPSREFSKKARISSMAQYRRMYKESIDKPAAFWAREARELHWQKRWKKVLDWKPPFAKWFTGARLNVAENCVDRHLTNGRKNKAAIIWEGEPGDQRVLTYHQLHQEVCRFANILEANGVKAKDRVLIYMPMVPEAAIAMLACARIGAVHSVVFGGFSAESIVDRLEDSGATAIVTADGGYRRGKIVELKKSVDEALQKYKGVKRCIVYQRTGEKINMRRGRDVWWHKEAEKVSPSHTPKGFDSEHPLFILYTSGSTGHPKGAISSHRNVLSALFSWTLQAQIRSFMEHGETPPTPPTQTHQPATLLAVPLFHVTGCLAIMLQSYRAQRKMVCMYKWDPTEAARLIEAEQVNGFNGPATMSGDLVEAAKTSGRDLSSLQSVGGGGAPRPPSQVRNIASTFDNAMPSTGWGMTETNSIGTGVGGEEYLKHPSSVGIMHATLELRIVDEEGNLLPTGERGELQIKGASIIEGYWERPDANLEAFDGHWLRTGDVAYVDEEGFVYIVDRIKDLVIRGGENIACAEVEAALNEYPDVIEASVYAVPDDRYGEEVGATVYSQASIDHDALRDFLHDHIAYFKIPRYIDVTDQPLPRIASGKINKRELRNSAPQRFLSP